MQKITLIYDGECPFCRRYARYLKLREVAGLNLVNARDGSSEVVRDVIQKGYNLDEGMVAIVDEKYYHGEAALHVLALMSSRSGLFNKLNYFFFSSENLSKIVYPFFRAARNLALRIKGVHKIHS